MASTTLAKCHIWAKTSNNWIPSFDRTNWMQSHRRNYDTPSRITFMKYIKLFVESTTFASTMAPFVDRCVGPSWFKNRFPGVSPSTCTQKTHLRGFILSSYFLILLNECRGWLRWPFPDADLMIISSIYKRLDIIRKNRIHHLPVSFPDIL